MVSNFNRGHPVVCHFQYCIIRQGQVQDQIDINSTLSQEVCFTLQQDKDALCIQDRPALQEVNTLVHLRCTIAVRFYVRPKYVHTTDIFILICICYIFML